jgi:hypothetical protein
MVLYIVILEDPGVDGRTLKYYNIKMYLQEVGWGENKILNKTPPNILRI